MWYRFRLRITFCRKQESTDLESTRHRWLDLYHIQLDSYEEWMYITVQNILTIPSKNMFSLRILNVHVFRLYFPAINVLSSVGLRHGTPTSHWCMYLCGITIDNGTWRPCCCQCIIHTGFHLHTSNLYAGVSHYWGMIKPCILYWHNGSQSFHCCIFVRYAKYLKHINIYTGL